MPAALISRPTWWPPVPTFLDLSLVERPVHQPALQPHGLLRAREEGSHPPTTQLLTARLSGDAPNNCKGQLSESHGRVSLAGGGEQGEEEER